MKRMNRRQSLAMALVIAFTVGTVGAALASPETIPGGNPNVTLDVAPNDGDNLSSPSQITLTGAGFATGGNGVSGFIVQCSFDPATNFDLCSNSIGTFTSNSSGVFTASATVTSTFTAKNSANEDVQVNCLQVACTVQAISNSGQLQAAHHISFAGSGSTSTSSTSTSTSSTSSTSTSTSSTSTSTSSTSTSTSTTSTIPPTTTSTTTTSTTPPTSTSTTSTTPPTTTSTTTTPSTTSTSTTVPGATTTTIFGAGHCAQLRQIRAQFNLQIDQVAAAVTAGIPASQRGPILAQLEAARAQGNTQIDQALASLNCG